MDNIIEVKNLCKNYKDFKLDNVSFSLERGYVMGFIGTNGAGKSTTIKAMMNLIKRNSGDIKLFGLDNIKDEVQIKDKIGFVYDENFYCEELNIENMKALVKPFYSKWNEDTFKKYLKLFDLDPKKKIRKLSKGMKTKFSLAIALSHEAELIIMDEPTAGLDPVFRREILEILHDLIEDENKGIFFSTHITSDLEKIADYITFIENGKIVFSKSKEEIDDNYCMVRGNKGDIHRLDKSLLIGYKENAFGFEALTKKKRVVNELLGNSVIIEKASLEDIMVNYTREVR
ncbi:ABC transporter ATP-binding protein [Hathewaya limosa]|uniref:ABC-2 type transport system ATP-binding protein n=1 Tax=Hathewaya limosa TaxID=1536 RepID=A0ABU0JUJ2_HATLI|nr:ABC transporter ATP-binding protein [Hathewaya limosa]AWZ47482.1 sodium ABC transporter ATP-binding protein [Clostridiaceae bacterium 14S0207]MDQ0480070.1 ABC-2 type transport system ATP-binding protein [Hathewaya limosa]